jgi:hypothetical protein
LLTAYQEDLLSLNELRRRMPAMRQREQRLQDELRSFSAQLVDPAAYLRLAETLTALLERLRSHAETLDVQDRQRITRLLVKEVVVADDSIAIRFPPPRDQTAEAEDRPGPSDPRKDLTPIKAIFRVHGVMTPPCQRDRREPLAILAHDRQIVGLRAVSETMLAARTDRHRALAGKFSRRREQLKCRPSIPHPIIRHIQLSYYCCRRACRQCLRWNFSDDYRTRRNHGVITYFRSSQYH